MRKNLTDDQLIEFSSQQGAYLREFIALADQKAAFLFATFTAMLVYLYSQKVVRIRLLAPQDWSMLHVLTFFGTLGLVAGAVFAFGVVWPRGRVQPGIIYWESITATYKTAKSYCEELSTLTPSDLARTRLEHCHALAGVASRKYRWLRLAGIAGAMGLAASVIYLGLA